MTEESTPPDIATNTRFFFHRRSSLCSSHGSLPLSRSFKPKTGVAIIVNHTVIAITQTSHFLATRFSFNTGMASLWVRCGRMVKIVVCFWRGLAGLVELT